MNKSLLSRELARLVRGRVVGEVDDADFQTAVRIDNGRINQKPKLVVIPETIDDVLTTVKFATRHDIRFTTKSGGHSAAGYCLNTGGLVMDLKQLNQMRLNPNTGVLKLQLGSRWSAVYDYMQTSRTGRIPVGGGCLSVGVAGFVLGGGYSFASRSYGLGCDNLRSLSIITADGAVRRLKRSNKDKNLDDLFWACCGGGGGNFGVAVEAELQTHIPNSERMLVGQVLFPFYRIAEILAFYNKWVETLPDEMAVYGFIGNQTDPRNGNQPLMSLRFTPVYNGKFEDGLALLRPLLNLRPINSALYDMTLPEWEKFIGSGTLVNGRSAYIRSLVMPTSSMTPDVATVFMEYMSRCPSRDTFLVWTHTGGAVSKIDSGATAYPHRRARFVPEVKAIWDLTKPDLMRANVEWAYKFFNDLSARAHAMGAYLNYIDPLLSDWPQQYYGANYKRLEMVKKIWDKNDLFSFQQSVGTKFRPSKSMPLDLSPLQFT